LPVDPVGAVIVGAGGGETTAGGLIPGTVVGDGTSTGDRT
jgi:hypothetical protein